MDCYVRHILLISDLYDTRIFPYAISKKWLYIQVKMFYLPYTGHKSA